MYGVACAAQLCMVLLVLQVVYGCCLCCSCMYVWVLLVLIVTYGVACAAQLCMRVVLVLHSCVWVLLALHVQLCMGVANRGVAH